MSKKYNPNSLENRYSVLLQEVKRSITVFKGLAALAEQYSEGCDTEMLALLYSIESEITVLEETVNEIDQEKKQ